MIMPQMITILVIIILPSQRGDFNETCYDKGVVTIKGYVVQYNSHYEWLWSSWAAQLVKNLPAMQETLVQFLVRKFSWRRDRLPTPVLLSFPGSSTGKESACNAGDLG